MHENDETPRLWKCRCEGRNQCPTPFRHIVDLQDSLGEKCHFLKGGLSFFNYIASQFHRPSSVIMGTNSLLSIYGPISKIQSQGTDFTNVENSAVIRSHSSAQNMNERCCLAYSEGYERRPAALYLFNEAGEIIHRIDVVASEDTHLLAACVQNAEEWLDNDSLELEDANKPSDLTKVISLAPYLRKRQQWRDFSPEDHLDDILEDNGASRLIQLRHLDNKLARAVDKSVLVHLFSHLSRCHAVFTTVMVQTLLLQAYTGPVQSLDVDDGLIFIYSTNSIAVLDLTAINEIWVVQHKAGKTPTVALEIYDNTNNCLAVLSPSIDNEYFSQADWISLLHSLPAPTL